MVCGAVFAPGEDIQLHFITTHLPKDGESDESDDEINTEIQVTSLSNVSHRYIIVCCHEQTSSKNICLKYVKLKTSLNEENSLEEYDADTNKDESDEDYSTIRQDIDAATSVQLPVQLYPCSLNL